ncbi:MAG: hypothetical protein WCP82_10180 [Alphaproteobacteria bacterium]
MTFWVAGSVVVGAVVGSQANKSAARTQADATNNAVGITKEQADRTYADQAPYRQAGVDALGKLQTDINRPTTAADVMSDPGYQFGLDQGQQAIDRKIAASGGRVSGAAIKAASRFGTNYAATGYTAADQRRNDRLNRLAALAGIGQTSTNASAVSGANAANNIAGMTTAQGNATGASQIAQGNIWANTGNQIAALYGRGQPTAGGYQGGGGYGSVSGGYVDPISGTSYNNPSAYVGP